MPEINDNLAALVAEAGATAPIIKSVVGTVGAGAALTVWTPGLGKRLRLRSLRVAVDAGDITAPYEVYDGGMRLCYGVDQGTFTLVLWLDVPAPGYLSLAANNALTIKNTSGTPATILVIAVGDEV